MSESLSGLVVDSIGKQFPTRTEPLTVLREASFRLAPGENVAILGPSGSGKSTLLHIIGTLDSPTSGSVMLNGENPFVLDERQLARYRNRHIGFVFQDHHLLPQLSALENVLVPTVAEGRPGPELIERARSLLERVGLSDRLNHRPAELSGGERQRVGVARSLILQPELVLADEPTGNLDRNSAAEVGRLLVDLQQLEDAMLVVVTHSPELAALLRKRYELVDGTLAPIPTDS